MYLTRNAASGDGYYVPAVQCGQGVERIEYGV